MTAQSLDYANDSVPALPSDVTTWSIRTFNRICYVLALLWIGGALFLSLRIARIESADHEYHDFSQFYMGGLVARRHAWEALYPIPHAQSVNSPGEWEDADSRPAYQELAAEAGVPEHSSRYIQPPPFALMLEPVAALPYRMAKKTWNVLMVLCAWGAAVMAGKSYELVARRRSPIAGGLALLVAISPLTLDTLRFMNMTPLMAVLIGFSVYGVLAKRGEGGAVALVVGAASKYATAMLLPLYVAARKWSALIVMAVVSIAIIVASLAVMKTGPFVEFFKISKTFARVHTDSWNRSLPGLLMHIANRHGDPKTPIHSGWFLAWQVAQWGSLAVILAIVFTRKSAKPQSEVDSDAEPQPAASSAAYWAEPAHVFAGAAALLTWFLIFSPILWDHYVFYAIPLWGWLSWEAGRSWVRAIPAAFAVLYPCQPDYILEANLIRGFTLQGPFECGMLLSLVVMMLLAIARLLAPRVVRRQSDALERRTTFRFTTVQFNRACAALAAAWLIYAVPGAIVRVAHYKPHSRLMPQFANWDVDKGDFPQFYMGAVMARLRAWDSLYPIPNQNSIDNAGMPQDSTMRPRYAAEAERRGVGDRLRFIQPPPVALLLLPMGYLSYERAFQVFTLVLIVCAWGIAVYAAKVLEILCGRPTRRAGLLMLLVAVSPLMLDAIIIANMSVIVGLCVAVGVVEMIRRREALPAAGIVLGGVTKYATLALLLLALVTRRWKTAGYALILAAVLVGGTYAITGSKPFNTYRREIAPTLSRTHSIETNQSLPSFLQRVRHETVLPRPMKYGLLIVRAVALLALLWLLASRPRAFWQEPGHVLAGAAALLTFVLIFSPVFWHHYAVYLCPLWGWLLWEGRRSVIVMMLGIVAIALMYVPVTYLYDLKEPFNTHMLPAAMLIFAIAVWRIAMKPQVEADGEIAEEPGASPAACASPA